MSSSYRLIPFQDFLARASAILESPQLVDHDYEDSTRQVTEPNIYSERVLNEQYSYISTIESENASVDIYHQVSFGKHLFIGVIPSAQYESYKQGIFSLNLDEVTVVSDELSKLGTTFLAVSMVYNKDDYRYKGLSSKVYALLAHIGYVILSDELHYKGARYLWKRLATLSDMVKVRVYDNANECFIKGSDGSEIYTGGNIPDSDIWSVDSREMPIILTLSSE